MPNVFTLTLNPCFDVTLFVDELKNNAVSRVKDEVKQAAGKGINVGKVLEELGIQPYYCMLLGANNFGEYLQSVRIDPEHIIYAKTAGNIRENLTVRAKDETYKINRVSSECSYSRVRELIEYIIKLGSNGDIIVIAGSLPAGLTNTDFVKMCKGLKKRGLKVALDCDFLTRDELIEIKPWIFKVNQDEFAKLCNDDDFRKSAVELCRKGIEYVVVTMGENGIFGTGNGETAEVGCVKVEVKSTVGAGDSAFAGLIAGLCEEMSLECSLKLSSACGTCAVQKDATGLADCANIEIILKCLN